MSVQIVLPPKPTVLLEVVSGGELQADTTYYFITWWQGYTGTYYGGYQSEASDEVSITTSGVNNSIRMRVAWDTAEITNFEDVGGGQVTVTSSGHQLASGEEILIRDTAEYDEEYSISNIFTDTFEITATYSGVETGTWYGVGPPSKADTTANGYLFMWDTVSMSGIIPWDEGGGIFGHKKWYNRLAVQTGITSTNQLWTEESATQLSEYPTTQDTLCTQRAVGHPGIAWDYTAVPVSDALVKKAKFLIKISGAGNTWSDVITAILADSRVDGMYLSTKNSFIGFCALIGVSTPELVVEGQNITFLSGTWYCDGSELYKSSFHLEANRLSVNFRMEILEDTKFIVVSTASFILDVISQNATSIRNFEPGYSTKSGTISNYQNAEGFTIYNVYQFRYIQPGQDTLTDMTFLDTYLLATMSGNGHNTTFPDWENLRWEYDGLYSYDIRWFLPGGTDPSYQYFTLLNPETTRPSGKIVHYAATHRDVFDFKIYVKFTFEIYVVDTSDTAISTANVLLKDKDNNTIIDTTTDVDGYLTQNVVSYYHTYVYNQSNFNEADNNPFTLTISKIGYIPYTEKFTFLNALSKRISLKTFSELPAHKVTTTKIKRIKITP